MASELAELLAHLSHELKTPLTSLQMCLHMLLENADELTPAQRELLTVARDDAERLGQMISTLLDAKRKELAARAGQSETEIK